MITVEEIKAAIDEYIEINTPPEGYHPSNWYKEELYPDISGQKMAGILDSMVREGKAEKSDRTYDEKYYYKIVVE